jgi:hypothetical protein
MERIDMALFGSQPGEEVKNLAEVFPPGTPFRLLAAEQKGLAGEPGAQKRLATIIVSPVEAADNEMEFGVWGSLAEQLTQLEAGELPAIVTLSSDSGVWQFAPHGPQGTTTVEHEGGSEEVPQRVNVEAHMVDDAPTDRALGAVQERPAPPPPDVPEGGHKPPVSTEPPSVKPTPIDDSQTFQPGQSS